MDTTPRPAPSFLSLALRSVLIIADDAWDVAVCCLKAALGAAVLQMLAAAAVHTFEPALDMAAQGLALLLFVPAVLLGLRDKRMGERAGVGCDVLAVFSRRGARMFVRLLGLFLLSMLFGGLFQELLARAGVRVELLVHGLAVATVFALLPGYMVDRLVTGRIGETRVTLGVRINAALAAALLALPALAVQNVAAAQLPSARPAVEAGLRLGTLALSALTFALLYGVLLALEQAARGGGEDETEELEGE